MGLFSRIISSFSSTPVDYKALLDCGAIVVDVRTPQEFQGGHAKGSINIPLNGIEEKLDTLKDKEVILVCHSGIRAKVAKGILEKQGITAYNAGVWQKIEHVAKN